MENKNTIPADDFLEVVKNQYNTYMTEMDYENQKEEITMTQGKRYYKISIGNSVHSFIDAKTSDIFKPAGWRVPAKHARGNCLSEVNGAEALDSSGYNVRYLR